MSRVAVLIAHLLVPAALLAYAVPIHKLMPGRALAGETMPGRALAERLPAVSPQELAEFRAWLDGQFRAHPDPAVRRRYVARFPAALSAADLKRLLTLNVDRPIHGIDQAGGLPCTALEALQEGSTQPDTDYRNRERMAHDAHGQPLKLADGRDVPADPLVLNMGNARGLSSQAHAHYGLADVALSPDPAVLRDEPWRFGLNAGWPGGPVRSFAREFCQLHYDLAVLAILWGKPAGRSLAHLFLGQGMHYLEDVGNQVHTVQVGSYDLLKRAKLLTWERALFTLGGYAGELKPWTRVGIDLITTHHVLSEGLNAKRIFEALRNEKVAPVIRETLDGLSTDDPELARDLTTALGAPTRAGSRPRPAAVITGCVIARSCLEGADLYRHMTGALHPRMHRYGVLVDDESFDPDTALGDPADPAVAAHLAAVYDLQRKAYRRVGTALRRLYAGFAADGQAGDPQARAQALANAFVAERLDALDGEEERLARYLADPPAAGALTVHDPVWLLPPLVLMAAGGWLVRRLTRRR